MDSFDLDRWNQIAEAYSEFVTRDEFRKELLHKNIFRLLGEIKNVRILDAGCGEGSFTKSMAERGALVSGVDGSIKLIEIARQKFGGAGINFQVADLRQTLPFPDGSFDAVVSNMVLMDFDPIDQAIQETARVMRPGGSFVIAILHPVFSRGELRKTLLEKIFVKPPHYAINTYKTPEQSAWRITDMPRDTSVFKRPIEFYMNALRASGFVVSDIKEPVFDKNYALGKNNFIKLCTEIPPFLILRAEKR